MIILFTNNGLIKLKDLYWPKTSIILPDIWWHLIDNEELRLNIQKELHKEIGKKHLLWGLKPVVFAKIEQNDDVLVHLNNGNYAIVHLVWHGHIDMFPADYPWIKLFDSERLLQIFLNYED